MIRRIYLSVAASSLAASTAVLLSALGASATGPVRDLPRIQNPTAEPVSAPDGRHAWGQAVDDTVVVGDTLEAASTAPGASPAARNAALTMSLRAAVCARNLSDSASLFPCLGDPVKPLPECEAAGVETLAPLWRRTRPDAASAWTEWSMTAPATCATAPTITPDLVLAEFRRMTLTPSPLVVQPDRGWVLVNKETIVYADPAAQQLTTSILGTAVTITATPSTYTWDFADGAPLSTASPGHPWPHQDVWHTYSRAGTFAITLTTTWSATFTTAGDPTVRHVPGTATTTSTSAPFVARELHSHLVATTCDQDPHAPGCD